MPFTFGIAQREADGEPVQAECLKRGWHMSCLDAALAISRRFAQWIRFISAVWAQPETSSSGDHANREGPVVCPLRALGSAAQMIFTHPGSLSISSDPSYRTAIAGGGMKNADVH